MRDPDETRRWLPIASLVVLAMAILIAIAGTRPTAPAGIDAPAQEFSAARALATMETIFAGERPHPIGTPANAEVRERIVAALRELGLEPELQRAHVCNRWVCGWVVNVIAVIPSAEGDGQEDPRPAVMLSAHYDSVPAGPGIGDDGSGVGVVLESARALLAGPPPRNPVILLIDDGEEVGLLGAKAFADQHPLAKRVAVVVNAEARGSRGAARMFETKGPSAWMIDAYAPRSRRGMPSSLSAAIYRRMPNDTDLTIFGDAGMSGLNFAFIGGVEHYHTANDDFAHLDPGSLQHLGDNVLAAAQGLAAAELRVGAPPAGDQVFHRAFAMIVRMPQGLALPLVIAVLALVIAAAAVALRRGRARGRTLALALASPLLTLIAAALLALGIDGLMKLVAGSTSAFVLHPAPRWLALGAATIAVVGGLGAWVGKRCRGDELRIAVALWPALLALAVTLALPGGAMVFLLIGFAAALPLLAVLVRANEGWGEALDLAALGIMIAVVLELGLALAEAFGFALAPALGVVLALALLPGLTIVAALARRWPKARARIPAVAAGLAVILAVIAGLLPVYSVDHTLGLSMLVVHDRPAGRTEILGEVGFDEVPPAGAIAALGEARPRQPWARGQLLQGPVLEPGALPEPDGLRLEQVESQALPGGGRRIRGRLRSSRGSPRGQLLIPVSAGLRGIHLDGARVEPREVGGPDGSEPRLLSVIVWGLPEAGAQLELELEGDAPVELRTVDVQLRAPTGSDAVDAALASRPAWIAPVQDGDRELVLDIQEI